MDYAWNFPPYFEGVTSSSGGDRPGRRGGLEQAFRRLVDHRETQILIRFRVTIRHFIQQVGRPWTGQQFMAPEGTLLDE